MSLAPVKCPDHVCVPQEEWDKLSTEAQQFLREAEAGGLRYLAENGEVCAWGVAYDALFSMNIDVEPHSADGFLITLPKHT